MKTVTKKRIKRILAETNWRAYWETVAKDTEPEIAAYAEARRKSLARAHQKILR